MLKQIFATRPVAGKRKIADVELLSPHHCSGVNQKWAVLTTPAPEPSKTASPGPPAEDAALAVAMANDVRSAFPANGRHWGHTHRPTRGPVTGLTPGGCAEPGNTPEHAGRQGAGGSPECHHGPRHATDDRAGRTDPHLRTRALFYC